MLTGAVEESCCVPAVLILTATYLMLEIVAEVSRRYR
jgi:hypothetical protein